MRGAPSEMASVQKSSVFWVAGFQCTKCKQRAASILYFPCGHYYTCLECYRSQPEKKSCGECHKKIQNYMQIFVS